MIGSLSPAQTVEFLQQKLVGRIAFYSDDQLYVVPISYAYDGVYIYCHSYEGKKMDMLRKNPNICFEVDDITDMANWKSVIVWGRAEELPAGKERNEALQVLLKRSLPVSSSVTTHLGTQWPFSSTEVEKIDGIVFRVKVEEKTGRFEQNGSSPILPG